MISYRNKFVSFEIDFSSKSNLKNLLVQLKLINFEIRYELLIGICQLRFLDYVSLISIFSKNKNLNDFIVYFIVYIKLYI